MSTAKEFRLIKYVETHWAFQSLSEIQVVEIHLRMVRLNFTDSNSNETECLDR